jgi:hypothetical protein
MVFLSGGVTKLSVAALVVCFCCTAVIAQPVNPKFSRSAIGGKTYPPAPRLSAQFAIAPAVVLPAAAKSEPEQIDAVRQWNSERRTPAKNGFVRRFGETMSVSVRGDVMAKGATAQSRGYVTATSSGVAWSGSVRAEQAAEIRLHLEEVTLPAGAVLWVYGNSGEAIAFDASLADDRGGLWTPSVQGDTVHLEIEIPRNSSGASFVIRELLEIIPTAQKPAADDVSCLIDAACITSATFANIDALKGSVAQLQYVNGASSYVCTGALINDRAGDFIPYLLTANHCISDQSEASSLQAVWDYVRPSCLGSIPSRAALPHSLGSSLLSTSENTDYTLLRLNSIPASRWFLGWSTTAPAAGTTLYRVSHPAPSEFGFPLPQTYNTTVVETTGTTCGGWNRPNTLYSRYSQGATWGGSSGSSAVDGNGRVVGQLTGTCFFAGAGDCDAFTRNADGAFSITYSSITTWLEGGSTTPVCTQNATTLCLSGDRFAVSATWKTADGNSGNGQAVRLTADTGYFWFFQSTNVEAVVKVLNACVVNQRIWVFAGGLTNVNVVLTVRDTKNGAVRTYTNPQGIAFQPVQDTAAFATCP